MKWLLSSKKAFVNSFIAFFMCFTRWLILLLDFHDIFYGFQQANIRDEKRTKYECVHSFSFSRTNKILCKYRVLMRIRQPHRRRFVLLWLTLSAPPANTGVEFGYKWVNIYLHEGTYFFANFDYWLRTNREWSLKSTSHFGTLLESWWLAFCP